MYHTTTDPVSEGSIGPPAANVNGYYVPVGEPYDGVVDPNNTFAGVLASCPNFAPPNVPAPGGAATCPQGLQTVGGAIQSDAAMLSIRESREAWHMAAAKLSDEAFSAILEAHPGLRERFASIAMAVANSGENLKEADAIEERIVEEMRLLGREAMQGWAETQVKATEKEIRQQSSMHRQGKKNSAGIRNLAKSRF
jgi:hypothetical protein